MNLEAFAFVKNGILIAIIAQGLIGLSLVWDKVLLKRRGTKNLFSYVFWLGALSVFGMVLIPFGYKSPSAAVIAIAFLAGVADMIASIFYYMTLKSGEASETLAIMGGFSPVATMAIAYALLSHQMTGRELIGFALMTAGGFVMFFAEKLPLKKLLPPIILAAGLFGLSNVLAKLVYNRTNFVSGYVWFTIGTFVSAMALLIPPSWRRQIFAESGGDVPRNRFWYFVNRFVAGVGSFLVVYAISRANPAIVNAISGVRYAVIFIGAFLLTKLRPMWLSETFRGPELVAKIAATCLVIAGLVVAGLSGAGQVGGDPAAIEREGLLATRRADSATARRAHDANESDVRCCRCFSRFHSPGGETGAGSVMRPLPVIAARISLPWNRPFSMKMSEVCLPPTTTPAT
jgi:drug/metabolite transporter (DMT)-like permease